MSKLETDRSLFLIHLAGQRGLISKLSFSFRARDVKNVTGCKREQRINTGE